ncbi:MAG: nicotinamide-nucleotide amidohydrolase family protein [Endomicrobiia bacterium]
MSTGTELLYDRCNTNLHYITKKLSSIGLKINYNIQVPDSKSSIIHALKYCYENSDITIITGGLGPTLDDITLNTVSEFLNQKIVLNKEVYQNIVNYFINKNLEVPELSKKQAYVIDGATVFINKNGHVPGQKISLNKKVIYLLPGPPREFVPMFDEFVFNELKKYQVGITKECVLHICGVAESRIEEIIKPVIESEKYSSDINFSILPHLNIVDIKITVTGQNELLVDEELMLVKKEIYDCFRKYNDKEIDIYGENNETLEFVVGMLLGKHKKTVAFAESCTSGMIAEKINRIAGSSLYFLGGIIAYSNKLKTKILNVRPEVLEIYGAVSKEVVKEMSLGLKNISEANYCVSISGIAGPGGGTKEKPVGTVWVCIYDGKDFLVENVLFKGSRQEIKEQATNFVLNLLRKKLLEDFKK